MSEMFADLWAAQKEMPKFQKAALNPFFNSKYVTLDSVLPAILDILHRHNLVLLQQPCIAEGQPALRTCLLHSSGEVLESTMLLQATKDDPQQQGSAITYARRYSILAWLGLTADVDDDAEATRKADSRPSGGQERPTPPAFRKPAQEGHARVPECPRGHGPMKFWPASTSKNGKAISANYKCTNRNCDNGSGWPESVWASDWEDLLARENNDAPSRTADELAEELPFE